VLEEPRWICPSAQAHEPRLGAYPPSRLPSTAADKELIQLVAKVSAKNWVLMQKAMHCYRMCRFSSQPLQVQLPSIVVDAVKG
jgi:hypothetical protein